MFFSWLSSILFFIALIVLMVIANISIQNHIVAWILYMDIGFGVLSCLGFFTSVLLIHDPAYQKNSKKVKPIKFITTVIAFIILFILVPRLISGRYLQAASVYAQNGDSQKAINAYKNAKIALRWTISDTSEVKKIDKLIAETPTDCVINEVQVKATKEKCDEWVNYLKTSLTPTPKQTTFTYPCTGGNSKQTIYVKDNSDCQQNYTDCELNDGTWKVMAKNDCNIAQGRTGSGGKIDCVGPDGKHLQLTQQECDNFNAAWGKPRSGGNNNATTNVRTSATANIRSAPANNGMIQCSYSNGEYQYNYGFITIEECMVKNNQYWDSLKVPSTIGSNTQPTTTPSNNQTTVNTSACYSQYNADVQRANSYGGNVGASMKEMAQNNLSYCLSSGNVTAVGNVTKEPPRDANGKLCSDYTSEEMVIALSMGCPYP